MVFTDPRIKVLNTAIKLLIGVNNKTSLLIKSATKTTR